MLSHHLLHLCAHGGFLENEASRKILDEFMVAWDSLTSKENERILILGATNRLFDLEEAVICRMPRRVYVGLPNVKNRVNILKVPLAIENIESKFDFEQLAKATAGAS